MNIEAWKRRQRAKATHVDAAGDILRATLKYHPVGEKIQRCGFFSNWAEIVGEDVARICYPEKISLNNTLSLRVIDPVWAHDLSLRKSWLLDRIHEFAPSALVADVRFIADNPVNFEKLRRKKGS